MTRRSSMILIGIAVAGLSLGGAQAALTIGARAPEFTAQAAMGGNEFTFALADALKRKAITGAAVDCFSVEPLPATSPLRGLPNAILTPHMIGHTIEAHHSLEVATRENLDLILSGRPPRYVVNPAVLPAWTKKWGVA